MTVALDHLGLVAGDLTNGAAEFKAMTGVDLGPGGHHPKMATHNRLLSIGGGSYLELIAPDPESASPARARWFGLDNMKAEDQVSLRFWMIRVDNLDDALNLARQSGLDLGGSEDLSRGTLQWRLSVPRTGILPLDGAEPILIEWPEGVHPTSTMEDAGVVLKNLTVRHPNASAVAAFVKDLGSSLPKVTFANGPFKLQADFAILGKSWTISSVSEG